MPIDEEILKRLRNNDPTLILLSQYYKQINAAEAAELKHAIYENTHLTALHLCNSQISDEGAKGLGEILQRNTNLKWLELSNNEISDEGVKALGAALRKNNTLIELGLAWSKVSDVGATALKKALQKNTTLTQLRLRFNPISDAIKTDIASLIKRNEQYIKSLKQAVCEQLKIGRVLLFKPKATNKANSLLMTLPIEIREKIIMHIGVDELKTEEQQRLVLNYAEGRIAPVADKLSFFKVTKCDRVMKPLQASNQIEEPFAKRLCLGLS